MDRRAKLLFLERGKVVFFGFKQAVDDIINHFDSKGSLDGDVFVDIDIIGRNRINLIKLHPSVKLEKRLAGRDKKKAAFFNAAGSCRFVLFWGGGFNEKVELVFCWGV